MPIQIAKYQEQLGDAGLPGYQQNFQDHADAALGSVGHGVENLGEGVARASEIYQRAKREQQAANKDEWAAQLSANKQQLLDPVTGLLALQGKNAGAARDQYLKQFEDMAKPLRDNLSNDSDQQQAFDNLYLRERTSFVDAADQHIARQSQVNAVAQYESVKANLNSDILSSADRGDFKSAQDSLAMLSARVEKRGEELGWTPDETQAQKRLATTEAHLGIVSGMIEKGDAASAKTYLEHVRSVFPGELDGELMAKSNIDKVLHAADDAATGQSLGGTAVARAAASVVQPWAPSVAIQHVDTNKANAELDKLEADPNVSQHVKLAAREHAEKLIRESEQAWKATLDGTYARAITKMARNGWTISSLAEEKAFLLSKGVDGGEVWKKIVDTRDNELRRQSGEPPTPAQHANMVKFLVTYPERAGEYLSMTDAAFMSEWGHLLSSQDLEQAAGYLARAGIQANKPDTTLPAPVIARIKEEGGPNHYALWDEKGPKTDEDNQRYLLIYNDLLQQQARLKKDKKPLDDETVKKRLAYWGTKGKVPGSGWFGTDFMSGGVTRADYESSPEYAGKQFVAPVDDSSKQRVLDRFKARGLPPPSDQQIQAVLDAEAKVAK